MEETSPERTVIIQMRREYLARKAEGLRILPFDMAAAYLNLDEITLLTLSREGEIPCFKNGVGERDFNYDKRLIDQWLEERCRETMIVQKAESKRAQQGYEGPRKGLLSRVYNSIASVFGKD